MIDARSDRGLLLDGLLVAPAGSVLAMDRQPFFVVLDSSGAEIGAATSWLLDLAAQDRSHHTIRAYAMSLLRFLRFLWAIDRDWRSAQEIDVRDFVLWAKSAEKFVGAKREASRRLPVNRVTGKRTPSTRYSPSTINHTLSAVHEFYAFVMRRANGPLVNPVPNGSPNAHHNVEDDFTHNRRGQYRQRTPKRVPRAMPDPQFNDFFRRLGSNRDRALVAFYVSSGARASELLGLTGDMINYGDQLIGVVRKGGDRQWLPVAPDAMVWLRLYQLEVGVAGAGQHVWSTLREPRRPLTYDALRAVLARINNSLGSNWSTHDLRHTFSIRALEGGMPIHELQHLLGHESLETTSIYVQPRLEDVIAHHRALHRRPSPDNRPGETQSMPYDPANLATLFGSDEVRDRG